MIEKHTPERRKAFVSECFEDVQQHIDYKEWEKMITVIYNVTFASHQELLLYTKGSHEETQQKLLKTHSELEKTKEDNVKLLKGNIQSDDTSEETFKIIRQISSGPNIVETERKICTVHENGTTRKTVVKDVYAKLTTRNTLKKLIQTETTILKILLMKTFQIMDCENERRKLIIF